VTKNKLKEWRERKGHRHRVTTLTFNLGWSKTKPLQFDFLEL
jgi:hypothetical protein